LIDSNGTSSFLCTCTLQATDDDAIFQPNSAAVTTGLFLVKFHPQSPVICCRPRCVDLLHWLVFINAVAVCCLGLWRLIRRWISQKPSSPDDVTSVTAVNIPTVVSSVVLSVCCSVHCVSVTLIQCWSWMWY